MQTPAALYFQQGEVPLINESPTLRGSIISRIAGEVGLVLHCARIGPGGQKICIILLSLSGKSSFA